MKHAISLFLITFCIRYILELSCIPLKKHLNPTNLPDELEYNGPFWMSQPTGNVSPSRTKDVTNIAMAARRLVMYILALCGMMTANNRSTVTSTRVQTARFLVLQLEYNITE